MGSSLKGNRHQPLWGSLLLSATVLAGLAFTQANPVHAAVKTVNYDQGSVTTWQGAGNAKPAGTLVKGQQVNIINQQQVGSDLMYQLDNQQWVAAKYVDAQQAAPATPAKQLTVTYTQGATTVLNDPAKGYVASNIKEYVTANQTLTYTNQQQVGGQTFYQLSDGGWLPAAYAQVKDAAASTTATTQPAQATQTAQPTAQQAPATSTTQTQVVATPQTATVTQTINTGTLGSQIVATARQYLGVPYAWGGSSPSGFDCSGLVQYVFRQVGINLPRATYAQEYAGTVIPVGQAQPGDLYFFGQRGSTYHVAIAIGNGQYIQAPEPGQSVDISSVSYYAPSFAMRVQ